MASEPALLKTLRVLLGQHEAREKILIDELATALRAVVEHEAQVTRSSQALEAAKRLLIKAKSKSQPLVETRAEFLQQAHAFQVRLESERQLCLDQNESDKRHLGDAQKQADQRRLALAEAKAKREAVAGRITDWVKKLTLLAENAADDEATERAGRKRL